ncbi:MAG TPA: hypothetical protein VGO80_09305 [Solirubrobacteraceae bacterium]|jgi:hypothetical protein|nr:hypothetical protein [Solirubrobacteraceae bacterium]
MAETTDPSAAAAKAAATRKKNATQRSTAAKKAAETRAANRAADARRAAATKTKASATRARTRTAKQTADPASAVRTPIERAGELAEKAVLVPVGAALISRDRVMSAVDEVRATYSTRTKTKNELRRFERRGTSALKSIERDAKKTRDRIGHELRQGRTRVERDVRSIIKDVEPVVKNAEVVGARVENAVQGGRTAATKASAPVQERLASMV